MKAFLAKSEIDKNNNIIDTFKEVTKDEFLNQCNYYDGEELTPGVMYEADGGGFFIFHNTKRLAQKAFKQHMAHMEKAERDVAWAMNNLN